MNETSELMRQVRGTASTQPRRGRAARGLTVGAALGALAVLGGVGAVLGATMLGGAPTALTAAGSTEAAEPTMVPTPTTLETTPTPSPTPDPTATAEPDPEPAATSAPDPLAAVPWAGRPAVRYDTDGTAIYGAATTLADTPAPTPGTFWADEPENTAIWVQQKILDAQCMAEHGFDFEFNLDWTGMMTEYLDGVPGGLRAGTAAWEAFYGRDDQPSGADYDWQQAGCHGRSVHLTGQDGNH